MASSSALIKLTMSMATTATTSKSSSSSSTWVRRITTTTSRGTARTTPSAAMMTMGRRNMNSKDAKNGEEISGWRLIKCAYFGGAQEKEKSTGRRNNYKGQKSFFSRLVADNNMGSENKDDRDAHRSPSTTATTTTSASHNNHNHNHNHHLQQQPLHQSSSQPPKLLTLPTILTLGRVAAVPILVTTFYMNSWWATTATTSIFIVAAITDWLDGYLARKMRLGSAFGAFLDPVADKLMVAATLVLLCTRPLEFAPFVGIPWLLPVPAIAIIGREITMSAVREWAASQNGKVLEAVAVNNLGKWKTASQMTALTILLASRDSSLIGSNILVPSGVALLYVSAWLAVWSLVVYMKKIWRVLLKL